MYSLSLRNAKVKSKIAALENLAKSAAEILTDSKQSLNTTANLILEAKTDFDHIGENYDSVLNSKLSSKFTYLCLMCFINHSPTQKLKQLK